MTMHRLDGTLAIDVHAALLRDAPGAAFAARVALPTTLPGAPAAAAAFADSAGRPVDALDVAVARALLLAASPTTAAALAGPVELAGPVPPCTAAADDFGPAARFVPAAVLHARPLLPRAPPCRGPAVVAAPATGGHRSPVGRTGRRGLEPCKRTTEVPHVRPRSR